MAHSVYSCNNSITVIGLFKTNGEEAPLHNIRRSSSDVNVVNCIVIGIS